jgi:hypothetical protein
MTATATAPAAAKAPPPAPSAPPAAAAAEQPRPTPQFFAALPFPRFKIINASENSDFGNRFAAVLPTGMPFERALEPAFWSTIVNEKIKAGDTIEVHYDDLSQFGELYVRRVIGFRTSTRCSTWSYSAYRSWPAAAAEAGDSLRRGGARPAFEVRRRPHRRW